MQETTMYMFASSENLSSAPSTSKSKSRCDWQSVGAFWYRATTGAHGQMFVTVWQLLPCLRGAPSLRKGWVCNLLLQSLLGLAWAIPLGSKSRRTHDHMLLPHWRLLQPGGPGSCIYIPQEHGGPVISPGTEFPFCRLLRLAGLWWSYSNSRASNHRSRSHITTDSQSASSSWCLAPFEASDQM
jgi:hypothetical protein